MFEKGIQEAFATTDSEPIIIWDVIDPRIDLQFSEAK